MPANAVPLGRAPGGRSRADIPSKRSSSASTPLIRQAEAASVPEELASEILRMARRHAQETRSALLVTSTERAPPVDPPSARRESARPSLAASAGRARPPAPTVMEEDFAVMEVEIPRSLVGTIIGHRGSVINAIRAQSGASIRLDKHEDGAATLAVEAAPEATLERVCMLLKMALEGELFGLDDVEEDDGDGGPLPEGLPPPQPTAASLARRVEAEELSLKWASARRERDYETADAIRGQLRAAGFEPETVAEEISMYGRTPTPSGGASGVSAVASADASSAPEEEHPFGYKPTVSRHIEFGPTEAAKNHRDGGTGGLLALNYQKIEPLPKGIGFAVTSGFSTATADALLALKRMQQEEEERQRREIMQRNAASLRTR